MKTFGLLFIATYVRLVISANYPTLEWDPDTVKDCVEWYDNHWGDSCEAVREQFGITPEIFHEWNPSVGLDCKPWRFQSYCIVTQEKLDNTPTKMTSSSSIATTTTSAATLGPSPTIWEDMGCYVDDPNLPILEQRLSAADGSLTIPKCKNICYRREYTFAGVQAGNQCWCSTYIGGEWAKNQTDCNISCTGSKNTFCGGNGLLNVFKAQKNRVTASSISTSVSVGDKTVSGLRTTSGIKTTSASSGALRNAAIFGMDY